ncbi:Dipeptidyl-peptidase 5 [Entomophthora muscae]|uniref:Dipeptidyl-peptidase 5 n=1 Tax=Entomophthora muscae TaxID=34485 RepID=A0ACC2T798_9FUNG|nr:Dipeptidyl-peptidase 5 [Entomophthora muscae]
MESEFGGLPWSSNSTYQLHNPSLFVDRWKTPTLIIHGAKDYRLVDGEGLAAFTALQRQSIPSRLLYFPTESHWISNSANLIKWYSEMLEWSSTHLNVMPLH